MEVDKTLLKEVKDYLKITWDDEVTNSNIEKFILQGTETINGLVGLKIDYQNDLESRTLLKDYCRYARHYSLEYFEDNFQKTILRLQIKYAVKEQD